MSKYVSYCNGVSLAMAKMYKSIEWGNKYKVPIYSLGNLIHNDRVLKQFTDKGVIIIEENQLEDVKPGVIVLRAHGVKETVLRKLFSLGFIIIDATCPIVIHEQDLIKSADSKYHIVVIGKMGHPEAMFLYSVETCHTRTLITCLQDVKNIKTDKPLFVVIQSTFPQTKANAIYDEIEKLKKKGQEIVIANTFCNSTTLRRTEIEHLAKKVDCIIVIGGKTSSNTDGLKLYAENFKKPVFLINSKDEIPLNIYDYESVGIATGTSTPQFIIDEIVDTLKGER